MKLLGRPFWTAAAYLDCAACSAVEELSHAWRRFCLRIEDTTKRDLVLRSLALIAKSAATHATVAERGIGGAVQKGVAPSSLQAVPLSAATFENGNLAA
jgi:hypothetical protein